MRTSWGALLAGFIALALAEPLLKAATQAGTGMSNLAKLASVPAKVVTKFMDPTVPAFGSPAPAAPSSSTPSSGSKGSSGSGGQGLEAISYVAPQSANAATAPSTTTPNPTNQVVYA